MELLAAALVVMAVFATVRVIARPARATEAVERRLDTLERNRPAGRDEILALPLSTRLAAPGARRIAALAGGVLPTRIVAGLDSRLTKAGKPMTVARFLLAEVVLASVALLMFLLAVAQRSSGLLLGAWIVVGLVMVVAPLYWLRIKIAVRRRSLLRALPDAIDLLVTTVEAGVGIDGALADVARETTGPLGEELRLTALETTLGRGRREAFERLIERTDVPDLKTFIRALIQAEQTGTPIGQVLRVQARQMRVKRRQRAEAAAQRAPVKMILAVILLILPAMLLIVIGPAVMRMQNAI